MPLAYGLIEPVDLALSRLPHALDRMRIAHITDLHLHKRSKRLDRMIYQLAKLRLDLGLLTGDYIVRQKRDNHALPYLRELTQAVKPRLGWYGIFGNHDRPDIIRQLDELPVHWLIDDAVALEDKPIELVGLRCTANRRDPDPVAASLAVARLPTTRDQSDKRLRLVMSHRPDFLPLAADLGADLMLAGHTHGGQVRLPFQTAFFNSSDLPLHLSAGLMRHRDTLAVVSRGLGNTPLLGSPFRMRLLCPPHTPVYTLHRRTTPGEATDEIAGLLRW